MSFSLNQGSFRGENFDFTGGLNNSASFTHIADNQASEILNMIFATYGPVTTRPGYQIVNPIAISTNGIYGLAQYVEADGTKFLLAVCSTKLYRLNGAGWDEIGSGLTTNQYTSIIHLDGTAYLANGEDALQKFDGSSMSATTQAPASPCNYLIALHNPPRIFALRSKAHVGRYYWCGPGTPEVWDALDFEELPNGDEIMGGGVLFGSPIIFGKESIWMIIGTDPEFWELRRINSSVGLAAPRSIVYIENELWFVSRDGIYALGGTASDTGSAYSFDNISARKVSKNIQGTWDTVNQDAIHLAVGIALDGKYELSVPISPSVINNYTIYCDTEIGPKDGHPWSVFDYGFRIFAKHEPGNTSYIYAGENSNGMVHKLRTGTNDNGAPITWKYRTKYFDCTIPEYNKTFEDIFIWAESSGDWNIDFSYSLDFKSDSGASTELSLSPGAVGWGGDWGVIYWHAQVEAKFQKRWFNTGTFGFTPVSGQELSKRGRYIRYSVEGNTLDQYMTLIGFVFSGAIPDKTLTS